MINIKLNVANTSGVLVIFCGRTYTRAPESPTERLLFLDLETGGPLLVQTARGLELPTFDMFSAFLCQNMVELVPAPIDGPADRVADRPAPRHEPEVIRSMARTGEPERLPSPTTIRRIVVKPSPLVHRKAREERRHRNR